MGPQTSLLKKQLRRQVTKARKEVKSLAAKAQKTLRQAQRTKSSEKARRRELRKQSGGASSPYSLYLKAALKGSPSGAGALQTAAEQWRSMPHTEKQPYIEEAAQNRARYQQLKSATKREKPMSKRNAFFKEHFATAFAEAKQSTADSKEAFKMATRAVSAKWKQVTATQ
eukprot:TRINITY_DN1131_c0_g3_i3.p1 TRINITY_DN1131_c0_g3~~TRINITY_DN1131_c0_g3_i3.p1  ORF type:complete len:170 (+),score=36.34 TRINITY_DN1131_c0_g3_i3:600-1109(+)